MNHHGRDRNYIGAVRSRLSDRAGAGGHHSLGQALPAQYTDARAVDPLVASIRDRIDISEDSSLPRWTASATLELNDGTTYTERIPHPTGMMDTPMSDAMAQRKFDGLATEVLGAENAARAHDALWNSDELSDVRELIPFLARTRLSCANIITTGTSQSDPLCPLS